MNNIAIILILIGALCILAGLVWFFKEGKANQIESMKEWLLFAVSVAEKEFGSGTGVLKLRFVYDLFTDKYSIISKFISFELFSLWVDEALDVMRGLIQDNEKVKELLE